MKRMIGGWAISNEEYETLKLIAQGHPVCTEDYHQGQYILVENPDFEPDNGKDPYRVLSLIDKEDY
jgi:hypothetical protein